MRTAIIGLAVALIACGETKPQWVTVVRDPNYLVAIDTAHVGPARIASAGRWLPVYTVWYRTDHTIPRLHNGRAFDRETVHSVVQCDSLSFKVRSVDLAMRDGKVVSRQRTTDEELYRQRWRRVERGTSEEIAAIAACHFGERRSLASSTAVTR